jgi:5-carboxymethyl-2-hydroxymuconate isomerase
MKLLSFQTAAGASYGAVVDGGVVDLGARLGAQFADLRALIASGDIATAVGAHAHAGADYRLAEISAFLPPIAAPEKILCIGVNYQNRNEEYRDGSDAPKFPSIFMRTPGSLVGHGAPILRPPESPQLDYEGEIVIVIGKAGRRIARAQAHSHIAGLTCMNEGTIRDWVRHAKFNVTQGKNFVGSGSIGPWIVTADEFTSGFTDLRVTTRVNGELRQDDTTASMAFPFDYLLEYVSTFVALQPGDIIATGTPTGAGARFDPPRWLVPGDVVDVTVQGVGTLSNTVIDEPVAPSVPRTTRVAAAT